MKSTLGWLLATLVMCMASGGWAESNQNTDQKSAVASGESREGYRFDADRFGQAMDRASGTPAQDPAESSVINTSDISLSRILGRTVLSLIVIIGAIYGLTYFLRNLSNRTSYQNAGPLRVLNKQSLSQKSSVYVVSTLNRFLIIGESAQGLTCLSEFNDPEEVENLKREYGWDGNGQTDGSPTFLSGHSKFAPTLKSHMDDLERELQEYEEVRR